MTTPDAGAGPLERRQAQRLAAQLLSGPPAEGTVQVAGQLLAVQAQDPRGARLAVRARSRARSAADVDDALTRDRSVVVTWLNRGTLHLVRAEDYWWLHPLTTPQLRTANSRRLAQEGVPPADAERAAAVVRAALAADQLRVVRVYRRTGISVDRLAMHPLDEVAGRERPHVRDVPGQAGVVEEVAPLAARAAAEERGGIDPVLRTAAGDGRAGPAAHRLERRRLDQAGPSVLVDVDAQARGQLPHLPLQVGLQVVVMHIHDVEIAGGVPERLQVLDSAPQRRPDLRRRRLVVGPLPGPRTPLRGRGSPCRST